MNILVSGANGFIGSELCRTLSQSGYQVKGTVRQRSERAQTQKVKNIELVNISNIDNKTDWTKALKGVDCFIHLAARVHMMDKVSKKQAKEYQKINVEGTKKLADMASVSGIKRFIFLSSIKVNGEYTKEKPFTENDSPSPEDAYAFSKFEAEKALLKMSKETDLEIVIIRSPLVYGPGVKANFLKLLDIVNTNVPIPLLSVNNRRSMIYRDNLINAIISCVKHPSAKNEVFLVSDREAISTPDLVRMIARFMGKKAKLMPFPSIFLKALGKITGKSAEIKRLINSLEIDSSKIRNHLGWVPPYSLENGISETIKWYSKNHDL